MRAHFVACHSDGKGKISIYDSYKLQNGMYFMQQNNLHVGIQVCFFLFFVIYFLLLFFIILNLFHLQKQERTKILPKFCSCGEQEEAKTSRPVFCGIHSIFNFFVILSGKDPADYSLHPAVVVFKQLAVFCLAMSPNVNSYQMVKNWFENSNEIKTTK